MSFLALETWIIASVAAAAFQTMRFMLQKTLSVATLTPTGATFARFLYSAPIIFLVLSVYFSVTQSTFPALGGQFWIFAATGGLAQVVATVCVVMLFQTRNFAVGLTLHKTEVILSVIIGFVLLGDVVTVPAFLAITLGVVGVIFLSKPPEVKGLGLREILNRSVFLGLSAGLLFGVSAVSYRGASLEVASDHALLRAAITLSAVTLLQMIGMSFWLWFKDRPQLFAVWTARRKAIWIGLLSIAGSFCWFFAFTLQNAAYVKAVGQIELVFGLIVSVTLLGERITMRELSGVAMTCASIVMLVLYSGATL